MQPGDLRDTIMIRSATRTPDGGGGFTVTEKDIIPIWAKVESLGSRERLVAMQNDNAPEYRVTIRSRSDIASDYLVMWKGDTFEIVDLPHHDAREPYMSFLMARKARG